MKFQNNDHKSKFFKYYEINSYFLGKLLYFAYRGFQSAFETRSEKKMLWTNSVYLFPQFFAINFAQTLIMVVKEMQKLPYL